MKPLYVENLNFPHKFKSKNISNCVLNYPGIQNDKDARCESKHQFWDNTS